MLTILYTTANLVPESLQRAVQEELLKTNLPIINISQEPMTFGENISVGRIGSSKHNHYWQLLVGIRLVKTPYVAICEDDCMYAQSHFEPPWPEDLGYNIHRWRIHAWDRPSIYSRNTRISLHQLICPTELFRATMEDRFSRKHSEEIMETHYGEPGRWYHDKKTGVAKPWPISTWSSKNPNVVFFHKWSMNYRKQGKRIAHGKEGMTTELPYWGTAEDLVRRCFS